MSGENYIALVALALRALGFNTAVLTWDEPRAQQFHAASATRLELSDVVMPVGENKIVFTE